MRGLLHSFAVFCSFKFLLVCECLHCFTWFLSKKVHRASGNLFGKNEACIFCSFLVLLIYEILQRSTNRIDWRYYTCICLRRVTEATCVLSHNFLSHKLLQKFGTSSFATSYKLRRDGKVNLCMNGSLIGSIMYLGEHSGLVLEIESLIFILTYNLKVSQYFLNSLQDICQNAVF